MVFLLKLPLLLVLVALQIFQFQASPFEKTLIRSNVPFNVVPYFQPFQFDPQSIDEILTQTGVNGLILTSVLAPSRNECMPVWDGNPNRTVADDYDVLELIGKVRQGRRRDVAISFGGKNGVELAESCLTDQDLADAYQQVIDWYQLTRIDFVIVGENLNRTDEQIRRFEAIKILRANAAKKGKELIVSLTMPVDGLGLTQLASDLIQRAISAECQIDFYQAMAFDFGTQESNATEDIKNVMTGVHQQLAGLLPEINEIQIYQMTTMILMNGHTDDHDELITQEVFTQLIQFAKRSEFGRVSFWSLNRDRQCKKPAPWTAGYCSSVNQVPYEFSNILSIYNH